MAGRRSSRPWSRTSPTARSSAASFASPVDSRLGGRHSGESVLVVGEVVAGRYELEELVGAGGMSSVFKARDTLLERHVALKVLHPHFTEDEQYVERFRREARAVASLSHPNVVTILDRGEDEGRQFLVFELVEGRTLAEVLHEEGRLPVRRALE